LFLDRAFKTHWLRMTVKSVFLDFFFRLLFERSSKITGLGFSKRSKTFKVLIKKEFIILVRTVLKVSVDI
jgi:hypothetical protein